MKKLICYILIFAVVVTTVSGCASGGSSLTALKEFEGSVYKNKEIYNYNIDEVFKVATESLHEKGYVITLSDSYAGLLTAEYNCQNLLPEEMAELEKNQTQATCITILGIVLIFGLVAMLISSTSGSSSSGDSKNYDSDSYNSDYTVKSNRYQLTFTFTALDKNKTEVSLNVIKSVVENGTTVSQNILENKFLNNGIFKKIDERLKRVYYNPPQITDSVLYK